MFVSKRLLFLDTVTNKQYLSNTPKITLRNASHRETPVVKVEFAYNPELIAALKDRTEARWSANMNCWYIPRNRFNLHEFFTAMKPLAWIDYSEVKNNSEPSEDAKQAYPINLNRNKNTILPKGYLEKLEQERYSENTFKVYTHVSQKDLQKFKNPFDDAFFDDG